MSLPEFTPRHRLATLVVALLIPAYPSLRAAQPGVELIENGNFENGLAGWRPLWTRDPQGGRVEVVADPRGSKRGSTKRLRLEHFGAADWSFTQGRRFPVQSGDIFLLRCRFENPEGPGSVTLGVITYDAEGNVLDWNFGGRTEGPSEGWWSPRSRIVVPDGVATIEPRLTGSGPATVLVDYFSLLADGNIADLQPKGLPASLTLSAGPLQITLHTADGTLEVLDRRDGHRWQQRAVRPDVITREIQQAGNRVRWRLFDVSADLDFTAVIEADPDRPEFTVTLDQASPGSLAGSPTPAFPHPFVSQPGTHLIVPLNEGISYPVDDETIEPMRLIAYGGHGICMAFWGITDGEAGQMAILETPDDAAIRIRRENGLLCVAPEWEPQWGRFGYARKLRYVFFSTGGHVAMAKRYREYARAEGRLKTLLDKLSANPSVDRLIGAVNVWCWDPDAVSVVQEMQAAGIDRILWSHRQSPENLRALNALGVLTSRYDIYQDAMNPSNFPLLNHRHPDWTSDAWPQDLMRDARGDWVRGWQVRGQDGNWYPCGVLCDKQAPAYAARRIPAELETHPYHCRFIDTTTASPWRECHDPAHPMTRTESREAKMRLLGYIAQDLGLVTGSETGHDAAVPFVHYFEGMLSLGPYRVPDAGRDMQRVWSEVPERVARFQLGHRYRLPLWELVYHDCVVAQWYWGDYNNKLPALWEKRDLFNALYGTPPMFMFDRSTWRQEKERFVKSYQATAPVARATGYAAMLDHRFLTPDRDVQQTRFANGVTVTVNFGSASYRIAADQILAPGGCLVTSANAVPTTETNPR